MERARLIDVLGIIAALAVYALGLYRHRVFFHDDAYISLRYARNLAEHGELAWNLGERAEGYTSLLHVLVSAAMIRLGVDPVAAVQVIGIVSAVAICLMTSVAARRLVPDAEMAVARALILVTVMATPTMAIWSLGGLEALMAAALLLAGLLALLGAERPNYGQAAVWFSLAILTRLDASVFITGAGAGLFLASKVTGWRRLLGPAVVVGFPAAVSFLQMAVRYVYYGELFPLTFYAKVGVDPAVRVNFLTEFYLPRIPTVVPIVCIAVAVICLALLTMTRGRIWILAIPVLLHAAYIVWSGGDHMSGMRSFAVLIAPAGLVILCFVSRWGLRFANAVTLVLVPPCVVLALLMKPLKMDQAALVGRIAGEYINEAWPARSTVALHTAGSTAFYATSNFYVDMLGLNTSAIAHRDPVPILAPWQMIAGHSKGDGAYVLSQEPDYIILGGSFGTHPDEPFFLNDVELAAMDEFWQCYSEVRVLMDVTDEDMKLSDHDVIEKDMIYFERLCPKTERAAVAR
ncbi:MAG: hypothetical protein AAGF74_02045 [Pseudomonadota bacterium]